jgi:FkbM family methyltransferase
LSLASVKEKYEDFVLVLAFASNRSEVLSLMFQRAEEYTLYMPDLPVCGEEYFDKDFYSRNYEEFKRVYESFEDDISRNLYAAMLWYKLTGDILILADAYTDAEETWRLLDPSTIHTYVDCGAYNGDTLKELLDVGAPLTEAICVEPDARTFRKLTSYIETLDIHVRGVNAAVYDQVTEGVFEASGNRNSSITNPSYQHKTNTISMVTVDSLCPGWSPDYIKYDVEGSELPALLGTSLTMAGKPKLLISLYHRSEDLFALPLFMMEKHEGYKLYLRRKRCVPAWEINLIALPNT